MMEFVYPHTHLVAGVDEVGRGPVGAVVTAAVISIRRSRLWSE